MITIHSDDYGYSKRADRQVLSLIEKGKIQSVSVLSTMVSKKSLKELTSLYSSSERSESRSIRDSSLCRLADRTIDISLHLNLVEKNMYKNLFAFVIAVFTKQLDVKRVEKEVRNQLSVLEKVGLRTGGIDSHQHAHAVSPVAEIVQTIADEKNLSVRYYSDVNPITIIAKLKYYFLKTIALFTHLIWYQKFGLPISWSNVIARSKATKQSLSFMSWEGKSLDIATMKAKNFVAVTHPYLPFDSNTSYLRGFESR